jgi:hypothetical protein
LVPARAAFAPLEESKVVSSYPFMFNSRQVLRAAVFAVILGLFVAVHVTFAQAQNFTLSPSAFSPSAGVDPGGQATATIAVNPSTTNPTFNSPVSFTCTVSSTQVTTNLPTCLSPSPDPAIPSAIVSLTVTTIGQTLAGQYAVTVTGTSGSEVETVTLFLNVVNVPQDYTLTISLPLSPGTVTAGNGAQATIAVTPIASYTGTVTLSCFSISPVVTAAPICAFNPSSVKVTNGAGPTSVLTISTYGPTGTTTKLWTPRVFYAFWLMLPGLAVIGTCGGRGRRKKWLGMLLLMAIAGSVLFLPSCGSPSQTLNNPSGFTTPKNTYTLTLTGVDVNGEGPSNGSSNTAQATVTLTVN